MAKNNHLLADIPVKAWIQHDGKVLLIQELDEFDGQWCLPGGRIDVGEMPREAMVREIKEELNLDATVGDILDCNIFTGKTGKAHFIVVFAVTIDPNQPIIVVRPGERLLGHTHEFIGIKAPGTSTLQARSTWGRNGVAVCIDAGWGDPGYINRWTLEIYNMNQHESVVLPVGERIAQMVFYETGPVDGEYKKLSGKYQTGSSANLERLVRDWRPEQMLPRAYKDKRLVPKKIKGLK